MNKKERNAYRSMLNEVQEEFGGIYRKDSFSFVNAKRLFFRIGKLLASYDKRPKAKEEGLKYYARKDIRAIIDG